jgi:hypothetical protein
VASLQVFTAVTVSAGARQWWGGGSLLDNVLMWPVLVLVLVGLGRR